MVNLLEEQALEKDTLVLSRFYESVKMRVSGIDNAEGDNASSSSCMTNFSALPSP